MNFSYVVGRFYFKKKKICLYAGFFGLDEAQAYIKWRNIDISPNSVLFIYQYKTQDTLFSSDELHISDAEKWKDFKHTVVYDCKKDTEVNLIDLMWKEDFEEILKSALDAK